MTTTAHRNGNVSALLTRSQDGMQAEALLFGSALYGKYYGNFQVGANTDIADLGLDLEKNGVPRDGVLLATRLHQELIFETEMANKLKP